MPRYRNENGVDIPLTAEEEQQRDAEEAAAALPPTSAPVSFDDFEARFQPSEWDLATDFVYEANTTTGKPKRKALVQGLARAQARNRVDLLDAKTDAFLSALVAGEVITAPRKAEILEP